MSTILHFDDVLPAFAALTLEKWGAEALLNNFFLRDADGRITLIVLDGRSTDQRVELAGEAVKRLGNYVDGEFSVATPDELFDDRLKSFDNARPARMNHPLFIGSVWLVDRRLIGADWLLPPSEAHSKPARIVFASIKGGVGRSTALCVLAAHLSSRGKRVLTLDMDLEAPGLGNMLLPGDTLPEFGLLDYLVEQHVDSITDEFYADLVGSSWLGGGKGRVDVIPAVGRRTLSNPQNALAKIARAYLPNVSEDGFTTTSFTDHIQTLLDHVALPSLYDIILIDARAGLHETSAAAIIGLGAEVLLFGLDQAQTLAGYELLFSHLGTLQVQNNNDWRDRLTLIQAKAPLDDQSRLDFADKMQQLMTSYLWPRSDEVETDVDLTALQGQFETEWEDQPLTQVDADAPRPIIIPESPLFQRFDPVADRSSLEARVYDSIFGEFLTTVDEILDVESN